MAKIENEKTKQMDKTHPAWRGWVHPNGKPCFAPDGTMLNDDGTRSVFDDVDE